MSQTAQFLDVYMLQENANIILSLMQQAGFSSIQHIGFMLKNAAVGQSTVDPDVVNITYKITGHSYIILNIIESPPVCNYHDIIAFFKDKLKIEIDLIGIDQKEIIRSFKILSVEVSQVKITATYDVCTVQSVLAAAVQEVPHPDGIVRGSSVIGEIEPVMVETVSMPDDDMVGDATAQIAYERFDDETYDTSASEVSRSSVEKRWVK